MRKWKVAIIFFLAFVVMNWQFGFFAMHISAVGRGGNTHNFKVMMWNINGSSKTIQRDIYDVGENILKEDADVVYVAEDFYGCCDILDSLLKVVYPYTTHKVCNESHYFYSKYPLGKHEWIAYDIDHKSIIIECSVDFNGRLVKLYGCHLSSNNYSLGDTVNLRIEEISGLKSGIVYLNHISEAAKLREEEMLEIIHRIKSQEPIVVMGDMNDVSSSSALRVLENNGFHNAWQESGFGYGATIHNPLPYRIDHIYFNEKLKLNSIKKIESDGLSDHDALVAEFEN